jgi:hydrogenase maturation protease
VTSLRIVGIGSDAGDDRLGWLALAALRDVPMPADTELHCIAAPATELLPLLMGARRVILVDAVASDARPGSLVRCHPRDLERATGEVSSHGLSVDTALDLAAALGERPDVLLIGLAVDAGTARHGGGLTRAVSRGMATLVEAVTRAAYAPGAAA